MIEPSIASPTTSTNARVSILKKLPTPRIYPPKANIPSSTALINVDTIADRMFVLLIEYINILYLIFL